MNRFAPSSRSADGQACRSPRSTWSLLLTLSDGETLNVNLLPMLELFDRERAP
jgi:hypothetical protein